MGPSRPQSGLRLIEHAERTALQVEQQVGSEHASQFISRDQSQLAESLFATMRTKVGAKHATVGWYLAQVVSAKVTAADGYQATTMTSLFASHQTRTEDDTHRLLNCLLVLPSAAHSLQSCAKP